MVLRHILVSPSHKKQHQELRNAAIIMIMIHRHHNKLGVVEPMITNRDDKLYSRQVDISQHEASKRIRRASGSPNSLKRGSTGSSLLQKPLGADFTPGEFDVICGRGRQAFNHPGNKFFRTLVQRYHDNFGQAKTRLERTTVVTNVIDEVRSKGMGFVKQDETGGQWSIVSDRLAREKVGNILRNAQGGKYRSSFKSKQRRRQESIQTVNQRTQRVVLSNPIVANTLRKVSYHLTSTHFISDDDVLEMFTQANAIMLRAMKHDNTGLLQRFNDAMCIIDDSEFIVDYNAIATASAALVADDEL